MIKPAKMFYSVCSNHQLPDYSCIRCQSGSWHDVSEKEQSMLETHDFLFTQCKHCGAVIDVEDKRQFCPCCERELD